MDRAVDANLNRAQEALRVLEDVARFVLSDDASAEKAKSLRHALTLPSPTGREGSWTSYGLLSARQVQSDGNAHLNPATEMSREGLPALLAANARRAEQALRSLEEFAKLQDAASIQKAASQRRLGRHFLAEARSAASLKKIRFEVYALEKELVGKMSRHNKRQYLRGLYVVLDPEVTDGRDVLEIARQALAGGARLIQLRDKRSEKGRKLELSRKLKNLATQAGALFIVNDDVDIALLAQADGVHLGQSDLPVKEIRGLLSIDMLIGCSTHNAREALRAEKDGADYISVGCLFPTESKKDARPTSLRILQEIRKIARLPIVGIGGINKDNIAQVYQAGADMAGVISAVGMAEDPAGMARRLSCSRIKPAFVGGLPL